jgi:hypothetical protein
MGFVARVVGMVAGMVLVAASMTVGLQRLGQVAGPSSVHVALTPRSLACLPTEQVFAQDGDDEARLLRLRLATPVPVERRPSPSSVEVTAAVCVDPAGRVRQVKTSSLHPGQRLIFEGKVRAWRFAPGPARCYRDRFWVTR